MPGENPTHFGRNSKSHHQHFGIVVLALCFPSDWRKPEGWFEIELKDVDGFVLPLAVGRK